VAAMRLLLDSHITTALAEQLRRHGLDAVALPEWRGGNHIAARDEDLLRLAHADGRVLVTFDLQTIPPLLMDLAETGEHHGGVILVSSRAYRANDVGGLLHALLALVERRGKESWEDVAVYLES
jgi:predicted nuclease of predicted toxin-antitoxin system